MQYNYPILTVRASNHGLKDKFKLNYLMSIYGKKRVFLHRKLRIKFFKEN